MWFRQLQVMALPTNTDYAANILIPKLEAFSFHQCLPSMSESMGWISIIDEEDAPLLHTLNGYSLLCLQIEEKILPRAVVRQALANQTKQVELREQRKIRKKEKLTLEDEVIRTLLPRAFTKLSRIYGYIDTKRHWLVLGTTMAKRAEQFINIFKKSICEPLFFEPVHVAPILTDWLKNKSYPAIFNIEKKTVLQDQQEQSRVIRCQQQDLFANGIQLLLKDGCEVKEIALTWQDRVHFVLKDNLHLSSIQYEDHIKSEYQDEEAATIVQNLNSNFFIMTETLGQLLSDLMMLFFEKTVLAEVSNL